MKLERFTWKLAMIWLSFRMVADMIGRTLRGFVAFLGELVELTVRFAGLAIIAAGMWWGWQKFGHLLI